jgi:hypothetical protein
MAYRLLHATIVGSTRAARVRLRTFLSDMMIMMMSQDLTPDPGEDANAVEENSSTSTHSSSLSRSLSSSSSSSSTSSLSSSSSSSDDDEENESLSDDLHGHVGHSLLTTLPMTRHALSVLRSVQHHHPLDFYAHYETAERMVPRLMDRLRPRVEYGFLRSLLACTTDSVLPRTYLERVLGEDSVAIAMRCRSRDRTDNHTEDAAPPGLSGRVEMKEPPGSGSGSGMALGLGRWPGVRWTSDGGVDIAASRVAMGLGRVVARAYTPVGKEQEKEQEKKKKKKKKKKKWSEREEDDLREDQQTKVKDAIRRAQGFTFKKSKHRG